MSTNTKIILFLILLTPSLTLYAGKDEHSHVEDHEFEEHSSHEHGHATAKISLSDNILKFELVLPSIDIFGFEHEPKNNEQHAKIDQSKSNLEDSNKIINIKPNQLCSLDSADVKSEIIDSDSNDNHHDDHESDRHSSQEHEEVHSDVTAQYIYNCSNSNIESINFTIFDQFPTLEEITVQFVSEEMQKLFTATPESHELHLK